MDLVRGQLGDGVRKIFLLPKYLEINGRKICYLCFYIKILVFNNLLQVLGKTSSHGTEAVFPGLFGLGIHNAAQFVFEDVDDDTGKFLIENHKASSKCFN